MGQSELSRRPYSKRQLIVVADDEVANAEREAKKEAPRKTNWVDVASASLVVLGVAGIAGQVAVELYRSTQKMRERGFPVLTISETEATELQFPLGHPRFRILYVGHPAVPTSYIPMADFHRFLFEHKVAEAFALLAALGAEELEIERISGKSTLAGISASLPVPIEGVSGGLDIQATTKGSNQILFQARLDPKGEPRKPDDLVWYPHEPLWQSITNMRLEHSLNSFALDVRYEDDFGVNAGLKLQALQVGLEIGGKFEDHQSTVWRMKGSFASS
jgi:hypothetical protein